MAPRRGSIAFALIAALSACSSDDASPGSGGSGGVPDASVGPNDGSQVAPRAESGAPTPEVDGTSPDPMPSDDGSVVLMDSGPGRPGDGSTPSPEGGESRDGGVMACNAPVPDAFSRSIAGTWDFTPTGLAATKIEVPGGGWIKQGFTAPTATYATRITVPDSGAPQTTLLEFGAVNHEATLTIDGRLVGTNMTAFTPSVFDITKFVTPGMSHAISVLVKGRDAFRNAAGRRTVPAAADWSPNVPQGIYRSAMIKVMPDVYVSDTFVRTSVTTSALSYDVYVTNTGAASRQLTVTGALDSWNCDPLAYPTIPPASVTVAAGATQKVTVGPIPWALGRASYWWPNIPYRPDYKAKLHNLRVTVSEGAKAIHTRLTRFGFRETEQRRADPTHVYYYLNGVRVNYRGDSLQGVDYDSIRTGTGLGDAYDTLPGFLPPSATNPGWPQAVRNYQRLNYNVVRIHQELAPPYMLDVADELGLMIIDETAIRGTDGQDFVAGHDNMVNHARAMVLRDRNHPAIIRWSQSNEENLSASDSLAFATELYDAIVALDPTRPVSADTGNNAIVYAGVARPTFAAFGHYLNGLGMYSDEVSVRTDWPFGQGECVWPADVTPQGMMWFATGTVGMRVKDASEIRPYTLLSAWASFVPGVTTTSMRLEPTYPAGVINPPLYGEDNLADPWAHPTINRIQRAFNPVLVADQAYWQANRLSNAAAAWPVAPEAVARGADLNRTLLVFNDTFAGTAIDVTWEAHSETATGALGAMGSAAVMVPLGSRVTQAITVRTPATGTRFYLVLRAQKDGATVFEETGQWFTLTP